MPEVSEKLVTKVEKLLSSPVMPALRGSRVGLEKESLRVNQNGRISQSPHPRTLGAALTHPYVTTDYSEALLEFITPPCDGHEQALSFLQDTQQFVYRRLSDELLWATSMPCVMEGEAAIPIAQYGRSNAGHMKTVYRIGLGHRYGKAMQVIAGVHFNYSFSDEFWRCYQQVCGVQGDVQAFKSEQYFALIRNLLRLGWLIPYLFGASPAICKSFLQGKPSTLEQFDNNTYYEPFATSLRMGDIGYQNNQENETGMKACYDSLQAYVDSLSRAIQTPCKRYEKIGIKQGNDYKQLNANILQIENEYYSTVRPKQPLQGNEKPSLALNKRGVHYIELRSLDVNAFHPLGIEAQQLYFLETLMMYCLLQDSPCLSEQETAEIDENEMAVAHRGRTPGLTLLQQGREVRLQQWAGEVIQAMRAVADLLDRAHSTTAYTQAVSAQAQAVADTSQTPSARMLTSMREANESFFPFAQRMSKQHMDYFMSLPVDAQREAYFEGLARESLERLQALEAADSLSFEDYLANYFAQS